MKTQHQKMTFKLIITVLFLFSMFHSFGQTLLNPNFEMSNPNPPPSPTTPANLEYETLGQIGLYDGATVVASLTNWNYSGTVNVHHQDHWSMGSPTGGGNQHIDLNGNGSIDQTITDLKPGGIYTISFYTSVHAKMTGGYCDLYVEVGTGGSLLSDGMALTVADKPWAQKTYTFTADATSAPLRFYATHAGYFAGGALIDNIEITLQCDPDCKDEDWVDVTTGRAPTSHFDQTYRIGNTGIGTYTPTWNFKLTVDNTNGTGSNNTSRNAIKAIAKHDPCTFGYGVLVSTNADGGTKAVAVQGDGSDKAVTYGNGMAWFSNRLTIGGAQPLDICEPELNGGPILVINGEGTINGMNISSDQRFKKNIANLENTFDIVNRLNPVSYQYRHDEFAERNFSKTPTYGFIAQDLKEVLPNVVRKEKDGYYSVNYIAIIPVLTQAIKEQQATIKELENKVEALAEKASTKGSFDEENPKQREEINTGAVLFQNTPNPLNNVTFIDYYLPATTQSAFIKVIDNNGKLVKAFPVNQTGYGQLELDCTNLQSGTYHYTLIVDKQIIETKTMVVTKN